MSEHAVLVRMVGAPAISLDALHALEADLIDRLAEEQVGELEGHEIDLPARDAILYFYGPDADRLYAVVAPALRSHNVAAVCEITLRYGDALDLGCRERSVRIGGAH